MFDKPRRISTFLILRGILALVFGVLVLALPTEVVMPTLVWVFGAFAVIEGAFAVMAALTGSDTFEDWWLLLIAGILGIVIGVFALTLPGEAMLLLVLYIGFRAIFSGMLEVIFAVRLRKAIEGEWLFILSGAISILFGLLLLRYPIEGLVVVKWLIGIYALVSGIMQLLVAGQMRDWVKRIQERRGPAKLA